MTARYSYRFLRQYAAAPAEVRKAFDKQIRFLLENLNHPSLRARKYDEALDLWQARVNKSWRFYFPLKAKSSAFTISSLTRSEGYRSEQLNFGFPKVMSIARHGRSQVQSFPRKRESASKAKGNTPQKDWIPAFAGMTI